MRKIRNLFIKIFGHRSYCKIFGHKWSWENPGEILLRWFREIKTGKDEDHKCKRCDLSWRKYQGFSG